MEYDFDLVSFLFLECQKVFYLNIFIILCQENDFVKNEQKIWDELSVCKE